MNEYLQTLNRALNKLSQAEREEILADLREHFEIGLSQGKTEQQIAKELGEPDAIAKLYTAVNATTQAEKTKTPKAALHMVGATFTYRLGKGFTIGTLYLCFVLCIFPFFVLGPVLWLGAAGALLLAVMEFMKGFIAFGLLAAFTGVMLCAMGTLCLMGAKYVWRVTIGALSALALRWLDQEQGREKK